MKVFLFHTFYFLVAIDSKYFRIHYSSKENKNKVFINNQQSQEGKGWKYRIMEKTKKYKRHYDKHRKNSIFPRHGNVGMHFPIWKVIILPKYS